MATVLTISGADFSANSVGYLAPVADGLLGLWFLGGSVAETQLDRAGIANAVLTGSPTLGNGYVSFRGLDDGDYLQTSVMETDEITVMCVAKSSDTYADGNHKPMFISNYGTDSGSGGALIGTSIYIDGGTAPAGTVRLGGGQNNGGSYTAYTSTTFSTTDTSVWNFYAGTMTAAGGTGSRILTNSTTDQTNNTSPAYPRRSNTVRAFRIGAPYASFNGTCDVAFAAVYSRVLTPTEIETTYQAIKARLAGKHSITI